jgi:hypothetical protein
VRGALLHEILVLDQLLEVVGDVGAQIIAAGGELAHGELLLVDVEEDQGLDVVDVLDAEAVELGLDHFQEPAVQPLDQVDADEILVFHVHLGRPRLRRLSRRPRLARRYAAFPVIILMMAEKSSPSFPLSANKL